MKCDNSGDLFSSLFFFLLSFLCETRFGFL